MTDSVQSLLSGYIVELKKYMADICNLSYCTAPMPEVILLRIQMLIS